jgi:hypothetical protein
MFRSTLLGAAAALLALTCPSAAAADLPRRAWHGLAFAPADGGLKVLQVVPGGAGEAAGLKPGDIVSAMGGVDLKSLADVQSPASRAVPAGAKIDYKLRREGRSLTLSTIAKARPDETVAAGLKGEYGAATFKDALLRTHVTKPSPSGRLPAVLMVSGFSCSSVIDIPESNSWRHIVTTLAQAGFLVMRVEKPNIGDSRGGPLCEDMDLDTEAAAYAAGLRALQARKEVDPDKVFIFGHSLGGVTGPMAAAEVGGVRGIAAYGFLPTPWYEYLLMIQRNQAGQMSSNLVMHEEFMRAAAPFLYKFLVEKQAPADLVAADPRIESVARDAIQWDGGRRALGRDINVLWDLQDLNQPALLTKIKTPFLIMHGDADPAVMYADGPRAIARIVNQDRKGQGVYCEFKGVNHSIAQTGSLAAELKIVGTPDYGKIIAENYDSGPAEAMAAWFKAIIADTSPTALPKGQCSQPN